MILLLPSAHIETHVRGHSRRHGQMGTYGLDGTLNLCVLKNGKVATNVFLHAYGKSKWCSHTISAVAVLSVNNLVMIHVPLLHIWFGICDVEIINDGNMTFVGELIVYSYVFLILSLPGCRLMCCHMILISRDVIRIWCMGWVKRNLINLCTNEHN